MEISEKEINNKAKKDTDEDINWEEYDDLEEENEIDDNKGESNIETENKENNLTSSTQNYQEDLIQDSYRPNYFSKAIGRQKYKMGGGIGSGGKYPASFRGGMHPKNFRGSFPRKFGKNYPSRGGTFHHRGGYGNGGFSQGYGQYVGKGGVSEREYEREWDNREFKRGKYIKGKEFRDYGNKDSYYSNTDYNSKENYLGEEIEYNDENNNSKNYNDNNQEETGKTNNFKEKEDTLVEVNNINGNEINNNNNDNNINGSNINSNTPARIEVQNNYSRQPRTYRDRQRGRNYINKSSFFERENKNNRKTNELPYNTREFKDKDDRKKNFYHNNNNIYYINSRGGDDLFPKKPIYYNSKKKDNGLETGTNNQIKRESLFIDSFMKLENMEENIRIIREGLQKFLKEQLILQFNYDFNSIENNGSSTGNLNINLNNNKANKTNNLEQEYGILNIEAKIYEPKKKRSTIEPNNLTNNIISPNVINPNSNANGGVYFNGLNGTNNINGLNSINGLNGINLAPVPPLGIEGNPLRYNQIALNPLTMAQLNNLSLNNMNLAGVNNLSNIGINNMTNTVNDLENNQY